MKIALLGASGRIGHRITQEALMRGHGITAIARNPAALDVDARSVTPQVVDVYDASALEMAIRGHDAVVSAVGPSRAEAPNIVIVAARNLAGAAMRADVRRVIVVGGAGSLSVAPGIELMGRSDFPADWRPIASAHREALEIWRRVKDLNWTYVSPPALIEPGRRTGLYRTGHNDLLVDAFGRSAISMEDFAYAVVDTVENGAHARERITFAY